LHLSGGEAVTIPGDYIHIDGNQWQWVSPNGERLKGTLDELEAIHTLMATRGKVDLEKERKRRKRLHFSAPHSGNQTTTLATAESKALHE